LKAVRRYAGDDVGFVFDPAGPATSPLIGGLTSLNVVVVAGRGRRCRPSRGRGDGSVPPGGSRLNVGDGELLRWRRVAGPRVRRRCTGRIRRIRRVRGSPSVRSVRAAASTCTNRIVAAFTVDAFPSTAVYGIIDDPGLRLITCGGTFDPAAGSYESNIVAYATLTSRHPAT